MLPWEAHSSRRFGDSQRVRVIGGDHLGVGVEIEAFITGLAAEVKKTKLASERTDPRDEHQIIQRS